MDIGIIILAIIMFFVIIIFISLISYNMYMINNINSTLNTNNDTLKSSIHLMSNRIAIFEDQKFSNSIFITNMKELFFGWNRHLVANIYGKICEAETMSNAGNPLYKCGDEELMAKQVNNSYIEANNKKYQELWNIIIDTIKKLEKPFYHKYNHQEIDDFMSKIFDIDFFIKTANTTILKQEALDIIISNLTKMLKIYFSIISDAIRFITNDEVLFAEMYDKFTYEIHQIIVKYIIDNIPAIIDNNYSTKEEFINALWEAHENALNKSQEIGNLENFLYKSKNRFSNSLAFSNKTGEIVDLAKHTYQQLEVLNKS